MSHYEILPGFPPYGTDLEIVPIDQPAYSEGFVVQFFKDDGSVWIANCGMSFSGFSGVYEYPGNKLIVFAGGRGYAMNPNKKEPLDTFGHELKVIEVEKLRVACFEFDRVVVIEPDFTRWEITGLPFDGFEHLRVESDCVKGLAFNYMDQKNQPFTLDLNSREVVYSWKGTTMRARPYRALNSDERAVLEKLLSVVFPGRDAIREQVADCKVREWSDGSHSLTFSTRSKALADVIDRVPVEGRFGLNNVCQILLHVIHNKIHQLEFVTFHLPNTEKLPAPEEITVQVNKE